MFFVMIQYKGLFDVSFIDSLFDTNFKRFDSQTSTCHYDEAGQALILLAFTEIFSMIGEEIIKAIAKKVFFQKILGHKVWQPIVTKNLSDFVIWVLYNKALHWIILLNIPYFIILSPLLDYLSFQWIHFAIRNFYSKAPNSSEIGYFLIVLMNITFWVNIILLGIWFIFPRKHNCGPIDNDNYGWKPVEEALQS